MSLFCGLDWVATLHAACIVDDAGRVADRFEVRHDATGVAELIRRLRKHGRPPVAIERPSGLLVDTLIDAAIPVVPIHPNAVKACRPRYSAAQAKDDRGDAYLLADLLRTDGHRFRPLRPASDAIKALRALVRTREDLVRQRVRLANQLRSLLDGFWPGAAAIFADIDSPIALAFLARYPTPQSARRLGPKRLQSFLAQHRYCGRRSAGDLLARLRGAPSGRAGDDEAEAKGTCVAALVAVLAPLVAQIAQLSSRIEHEVAQLDVGRIVMSFPRAGRICAAQIAAELGDAHQRFQTEQQLAAEAGAAPVTRQSGKNRGGAFRWACNHRLRAALTCFADNSRHASQWASHLNQSARNRGCDHPHTIRILARAWIRVLWKAWTTNTPYDPKRHRAAQKIAMA